MSQRKSTVSYNLGSNAIKIASLQNYREFIVICTSPALRRKLQRKLRRKIAQTGNHVGKISKSLDIVEYTISPLSDAKRR